MKRTKIICTLGPASTNEKTIKEMLKNGMNVARINFSHGTHEAHKKTIELFRKVRDSLGVPAAIMLDTKGPEIRTGTFSAPVTLKSGQKYTLTTNEVSGDDSSCSVNYPELPKKLKVGNTVLIDDGHIALKVESITDTDISCIVEEGGTVSSYKGVNVPHVHLDMKYLSDRDKSDILFGIENDVDYISASFVRSKNDVIDLRKFLDYHGAHSIKIIAKIENNEGVENFDEILKHSDGIMVARGDMGVEIAYERLPGIQKKFIKKCYQSGKVVITATQMLESMINNATPTRAEITDVANAVFDGTSAIMLSGETAIGKHPSKVVAVMAKIAEQAEHDAFDMDNYKGIQYETDINDRTNAICDAACTTARDLNAKAVIAVTKSGYTARRVSKFRPHQAIVAATPEKKTFHQLSLSWGVFPVLALNQDNADKLFAHAVDCAKQIDMVSSGDNVVIIAGVPLNTTGTTNTIKVEVISDKN